MYSFRNLLELKEYHDTTLLLQYLNKYTVLVYPPRWGKTVILSMAYYFYTIENATENKELFRSLKISKTEEFLKIQGKFFVLWLDFKTIKKEEDLYSMLHTYATKHNIKPNKYNKDLKTLPIPFFLDYIVDQVYLNTGLKTVVLLDNYNYPAEINPYLANLINSIFHFLKNNNKIYKVIAMGDKILKNIAGTTNFVIEDLLTKNYNKYFYVEDTVANVNRHLGTQIPEGEFNFYDVARRHWTSTAKGTEFII
ncbi:AAA family ATPase [Clostridioides difficile]|nr:AAA family ATPase [Clostridioides difficile]MBY2092329.1 AAA family ATPase [Clostridioides difficile]HBE8153546.1 AAA family ATPase [Clostridioides difficile]HBF0317552.1 AAA family ATPase [Clostridioides difficile]HBF2359143.1 AAA family ATPase [Clostridioides difficile]